MTELYSDIDVPTLMITPNSVTEGSYVTMTCSTSANPGVTSYAFIRGESVIPSSGEHTYKFIAKREHSSDYRCSVTNTDGTKKSVLQKLDIHCKNFIIMLSKHGKCTISR